MTTRARILAGIALISSGAIASCGGRVMDSEGDSDSTSGGASEMGSGGSVSSGTGGNAAGSPGVGPGAVPGKGGGSGRVGSGGKSGGAGTVGIGGKGGGAGFVGSGGKGTGGNPGTGAVPAAGGRCAGVQCVLPPPVCPGGQLPQLLPGACCPTCGPNCAAVDCAFPRCGPGEIAVTAPGECCPMCVPQPPDAGPPCDESGYTLLRVQLEEKYGSALCTLDSECVVVALNLCGTPDCGVALGVGDLRSFESNLMSYAKQNCAGCGPPQISCPTTTPTARCLNGHCGVVRH